MTAVNAITGRAGDRAPASAVGTAPPARRNRVRAPRSAPPEPSHLAYLLHRTTQRMRSEGELLAGDVERLRASEARLLDLLPPDGARLTELSNQLGISKQALGQLAVRLTEAGFVEVSPDPADRRARLLRRTVRGDDYREAARAALDSVEERWRSEVGAKRYATFRAVLRELVADEH